LFIDVVVYMNKDKVLDTLAESILYMCLGIVALVLLAATTLGLCYTGGRIIVGALILFTIFIWALNRIENKLKDKS
jgi:hypothetical protein